MISVIIPALNEAERLGFCLQSLSNMKLDSGEYEIILVDGHSKDETAEIAQRHADCVISQQGRILRFVRTDRMIRMNEIGTVTDGHQGNT